MKAILGIIATISLALGFVGCGKLIKKNKAESSEAAMIRLGELLFHDPRISGDHTISCNTCHDITKGAAGMDGVPVSIGIGRQKGGRNAPTVWNAKFLSVQFWDGRADSLKEQAKGPITNPVEMGMDTHEVAVGRIRGIPGYKPYFRDAFGSEDAIDIENIATAIAKFEETLVTLNSPYDKYKAGDESALSKEALAGLQTFNSVGCIACHSGDHFAGPELPLGTGFYQKFPMFPGSNYEKKYNLSKDPGRFEVTQKPEDRNMWRVPQLRNIARTAPYFHNGSVKTLPEAVRVMAKTQLNRTLTPQEVTQIVAFLHSLNGEIPYLEAPELPQ